MPVTPSPGTHLRQHTALITIARTTGSKGRVRSGVSVLFSVRRTVPSGRQLRSHRP